MTPLDIARLRLHHQRLTQPGFATPEAVVAFQGAVQSQDYAGGKWGLGLRTTDASDDAVERAFADGALLRTHVLRPTWHFVTPADIRWLLALTAPRVHLLNRPYYRRFELDDAVFGRCHDVITAALAGGRRATRDELRAALEHAGIAAAAAGTLPLSLIVMHAELEGLICSGPRRGKQFTYALLEERVPPQPAVSRDEALAELLRRYFVSRGPATLHDFMWWSGLTMADAKQGIEAVRSGLEHDVVDGRTYWFAASSPAASTPPTAHLLPNYDEYFIGFKDRSAIGQVVEFDKLDAERSALASHILIVDGQIVGGWKRTLSRRAVQVTFRLLTQLSPAQQRAVDAAVQRYGAFLGLPAVVA